MRKIFLGIVGVGAFVIAAVSVLALQSSDITIDLRTVPAAEFAVSQPEALGLDVTIRAPRGDVLDALFVKQEGNAVWQRDIVAAALWADAGATGFQGIGVDRKIATGAWNATENGWAFAPIGELVAEAGTRFFVTMETGTSPTNGATIQLGIPSFRDRFSPMTYDTGDLGVFLRTARPAPAQTIVNSARQTIATRSVDDRAPLVRITEPKAGDSFGRDWLMVRGVAADSGGSAVSRVRVGINRPGRAITWVDATPEVAGFTTWEARFFELNVPQTYELRVQAEDWVGNRSSVSAPIAVELASPSALK